MMKMKAIPTKGNNFQEFEGCIYRVENLKVIGCNHKKNGSKSHWLFQ